MFTKTLSIGSTCQPAKRIRDLLHQSESYFFDWLITPYPSLIKTIQCDFEGMLDPEKLRYSDERKIRIIDLYNNLEYQHDFPIDSDNPQEVLRTTIVPNFKDYHVEVREKYLRRALRFKKALSEGDNTLLIRYSQSLGELSNDARKNLYNTFKEHFPKSRFTILWASTLINGYSTDDFGVMAHLPKSENWDGSIDGWQLALDFTNRSNTS
jgi:hypothetical protein